MSRWVEVPDAAAPPPQEPAASRWVEVPEAPQDYTSGIPPNEDAKTFNLSPEQQEMGEASLRGMAGGASFGLYNRGAGLYDYATGKAPSYSAGVDALVAREAELAKKYPWAHGVGTVIGGGATGTGLARGGLTLVNPASSLLPRLGAAATEGAIYGAAEGAGNTYTGKPSDYLLNAAKGGGAGAAVGTAATGAGSAARGIYNYTHDRLTGLPVPVVRAGRADAEGLIEHRTLGPDAMLPDVGPSMKGVTQGAVQGTGENRTAITKALTDRELGTVPRLRADVEKAIGPSPRVSTIEQEIDDARKAINATAYKPVLQGKSVPEAEVGDVIKEIKAMGEKARINLDSVADDLHVPGAKTPTPDTDPQALLTVRHKLDGMIESAKSAVNPDRYRASVLTQAREKVDNLLQTHVPGIKEADAKFAANRGELSSLERGAEVFDKGKKAIDPRDLANEISAAAVPGPNAPVGPPTANVRLRQGARADIERRVGTEADDLRALEKTLGGQADWAGEKAKIVFGEQPAKDIAASVVRNRVFRDTYNDVLKGSKTGQMLASRADNDLAPANLRNTTLTGLALRGGEKVLDALRLAGVQNRRDEIARLMAIRDPAEVARLRELLIANNAATIPQGQAISQGVRGAIQGGANALINRPQRLEIDTSRWR